eukprot:UN18456
MINSQHNFDVYSAMEGMSIIDRNKTIQVENSIEFYNNKRSLEFEERHRNLHNCFRKISLEDVADVERTCRPFVYCYGRTLQIQPTPQC